MFAFFEYFFIKRLLSVLEIYFTLMHRTFKNSLILSILGVFSVAHRH